MLSLWERLVRLGRADPQRVFLLCCQVLCVVFNFAAGVIHGYLWSYAAAFIWLYVAVRSIRELREMGKPGAEGSEGGSDHS